MKTSSYQVTNKQLLLAAVLIMTAVILLAAALLEPKQTAAGEWVPLNDAVETALASLAKPDEEGGADEPGNKQETAKAINQTAQAASPGPEAIESIGSDKAEGRLDINQATASELDKLKGIGPSKAQAIVQDRDKNGKFASVEDLLRVKGIGEKLLLGIRDSIVARP